MKLSKSNQRALAKVMDRLERGDLGDIRQIVVTRPDAKSPAYKRSLTNRVIAQATTGSIDARTYNQWASVGRQVKKGSESGFIFAPINVKNDDDDTYKLVGFRTVNVFAFDQTEPIPDFDGEVYGGELDKVAPPPLLEVAKDLGVDVRYAPNRADGSYSLTEKKITLATDDQATFFHELAHAIDHALRPDEIKGGQQIDQEVIADFTAAVLMEAYGFASNVANTARYIAHYSKSEPLVAIRAVIKEIEAILGFISQYQTE